MALTASCVAVAGTTMPGTVVSLIVTTTVQTLVTTTTASASFVPLSLGCGRWISPSLNRLPSWYNRVYTKNVRLYIVLSVDFSRA